MNFRTRLKIRTQTFANSRRTAYWLNARRSRQVVKYKEISNPVQIHHGVELLGMDLETLNPYSLDLTPAQQRAIVDRCKIDAAYFINIVKPRPAPLHQPLYYLFANKDPGAPKSWWE